MFLKSPLKSGLFCVYQIDLIHYINPINNSRKQTMPNIGHVQYRKSNNSGELIAEWIHADYGRGTGIASGNNDHTFAGNYLIQYFDSQHTLVAELDLEITHKTDAYHLTWRKNGIVTSVGVGMENAGVLNAGYYDVKSTDQ